MFSFSRFCLSSSLYLTHDQGLSIYHQFFTCGQLLAFFSPIDIVVRSPLLFFSVLVWHVGFTADFYLPRIKILINFAPTVVGSHAIPMVIVNIAMIGRMKDGKM